MELVQHLAMGFSVALEPTNIFYCFVGVMIGTLIGVLPGIGPLATIAMLLPLTFTMRPESAMVMLAAIYYGAQYGGSTTAILVNLPGESASVITTLDGYQMARKGRAGPALAAAALGSFFAGTVATILIAVVAIPLMSLVLRFGPTEYFSLMLLGIVCSVAFGSGSLLKAIGMISCGILLGLTGTDLYTGMPRLTFGSMELLEGFDFVAISVGLFGISEILRNLESQQRDGTPIAVEPRGLWLGWVDFRRIIAPTVRGTAIGSLLGILPGGGATLSAYISYSVESRLSKNASEFGKGAIEGVAAPESANNAGAQTSFIPMLSLGLPSNPMMAMMLGALTIHGITPGPRVITSNPDLFWGLIASMWLGNLMLVIVNLPLIGIWVSLLRIPYRVLFPAIVAFCCIGVYSLENSALSVYVIAAAGLIGYVLTKLECPPALFILGFVLGPMLEENFRRSLLITYGDLFAFFTSPISAALIAASTAILLLSVMPSILRKREEVFAEEE